MRNTITFVLLHHVVLISSSFRHHKAKIHMWNRTLDVEHCAAIEKKTNEKESKSQSLYRFSVFFFLFVCCVSAFRFFLRRPAKQQRAWSHTHFEHYRLQWRDIILPRLPRFGSTHFNNIQIMPTKLRCTQNQFSNLIYSSASEIVHCVTPNSRHSIFIEFSCILLQLKEMIQWFKRFNRNINSIE